MHLSTLGTILKDNWEWRGQIWSLAVFDLKKASRNSALGYLWFIIRPVVYIACFWFALKVGLKAGRTAPGDAPYILWLTAGIIPWLFMRDMLHGGGDVLHKYSYLVKKVRFPISAISSVYTLSSMFTLLIKFAVLLVVYIACMQPPDPHLIQVPFLLVLLYVFWWFFSMLMSPLSALSKDVKNLIGAFSSPLFWLSGVIFKVRELPIDWVRELLYFNPVTFFVEAFRDAIYTRVWIWEDPKLCLTFLAVFVATACVAMLVQRHTREEVPDVL